MKITLIESSIEGEIKDGWRLSNHRRTLCGRFSMKMVVKFAIPPGNDAMKRIICGLIRSYLKATFGPTYSEVLYQGLGRGFDGLREDLLADVLVYPRQLRDPIEVDIVFEDDLPGQEDTSAIILGERMMENLKSQLKTLAEGAIAYTEYSWRWGSRDEKPQQT